MLSIKIGSSLIPTDSSISLPLVLRNPLFVTDNGKLPGSYIFNTNFKATTELRKEFGQAHRVQKNGRAIAELPYEIRHGILRYSGNCTVIEANRDTYEIAFKVDNGDFAVKIANKTLKDLNLGGDRTIATLYTNVYTSDFAYEEIRGENTNIFEVELALDFEYIAVDITSSYSPTNKTFTSPITGDITFSAKFSLGALLDSMKLRVYVNSSLEYEFSVLSGNMNSFSQLLSLNQGDIVELKLWARSQILTLHYPEPIGDIVRNVISFTFFYGSFFEYWIENEFDINLSKDQSTSDYAIFPILNNAFLDNFPDDAFQLDNLSLKTLYTEYFTVQNYYNGRFPLFISGLKEGELLFSANLFTPFVYMNKLLNQIASEAGYSIINSPFSDEFEGSVLFNAYAENTYVGDNTKLIPVKPTFNLSDHVPDLKQTDFINYISQLTGFLPVIDNNLLTITFIKVKDIHTETPQNAALPFPGIMLPNPTVKVNPEYKGVKLELKAASTDGYQGARIKELHSKLVYKGEVATINSLPSTGNLVNDMYKVTSDNSYYVWQYNETTYTLTWVFFTRDWPLVYKDGEEPYLTITSGLSPVLTTYIKDEVLGAPADRFWTIPVTWQPGILEGFPDSFASEYGIQMLIYRGMVLDSNDKLYPLGTSRTEDYANDLFVNLNARELFTGQWKEFMEFIAYKSKPATCRAILTPAQLKQLQLYRIYREPGYSFIIKEIRVNMLHDSLSLAEMDVYIC